MTKVLYISHGMENSGYGTVSRNRILAMDAAGIDVVPRFIRLGNATAEIHPRILELEKKSEKGCDICIQHVLPHFFYYTSKMKCIGCFEMDQHNIQYTPWIHKINQMDELWVANRQSRELSYGVKVPIKVVPHAFDTSVFDKTYKPLDLRTINGTFKFYFIGELHRRKHITALLRAFHTEFSPYEPVSLVLKVNKFGMSREQLAEEMRKMCETVKGGLRLFRDGRVYKSEVVIVDKLTEEDMMALHTSCDCFVMPSYAESWCIPAWYATGFGRYPVCTDCGGMKDYISHGYTGLLVDCHTEPVIGIPDQDSFPGILTGRERWWSINILDLMSAMRCAYEILKSEKSRTNVKENGRIQAEKYSLANVGQKIKEILNG